MTSEKKVLIVATNVDKMRDGTNKPTGTTILSLASAYHVFEKEKYKVDFVSPKGGLCPLDEHSLKHHGSEEVCAKVMASKDFVAQMSNSLKPSDVNVDNYCILYVPGGVGQVWDVYNSEEIAQLIAKFYENKKGVIGTVGHGLTALLNVKLSNGEYLLKGKTVTGMTREEEQDSDIAANVPFCLQDEAIKRGANFVHEGKWKDCVQVSDRVCTGQNQRSAQHIAETLCKLQNSLTQ
jgi:putative intracellular protease/amidase